MKLSSLTTRAGFEVVVSLFLCWAAAAPASAARVCKVEVGGLANTSGEVTVATERGLPQLTPVDLGSLAVAEDDTAVETSVSLASLIQGMVGVLDATADDKTVQATLEDNASLAVLETEEIEGMFFSKPSCDAPYGGDLPKARVSLSVSKIRVPEGDRTPRQLAWTVENISSAPLPGDFRITWDPTHLELITNKSSGDLLFNLPPGERVEITSKVRLPLPNRPGLERGQAWPRPNGDPALDDPEKPPVVVEEGVGDCIHGTQPSATLLVPYFEVDLESPSGPTTLLAVTNQAEECVPVRMMLWSDWGVPTLTTYLYLSPNDVQTVNLRDLFNGTFPDTSSTLVEPACESAGPPPCQQAHLNPEILNLQLQSMRAIHLGLPDPVTEMCGSSDRGDGIARGYATVDVLRSCTYMPTTFTWARPEWQDPEGFFAATDTGFGNVLWGDYFLVDPGNDFAQGETAVHIPAEPDLFIDGDYTFYGRYTGFDASDGRVPLSSRYRMRFISGGPFDGGTRLHVWRDDRSPVHGPVPCGSRPASFPLGDQGVTAYDEDEASAPIASLATLCPVADRALAFSCTVPSGLGSGIDFGFLDLALGAGDGSPAQAWVSPVMNAEGRYSVAFEATRVDDLCHVAGRAEVVP